MSLTFYFAPNSTASTVHWTLEELGIPYETVRVDLQNEANKKAQLGSVNPNLLVPTVVHEGVPIFESAAIQIYLGETFGVERGLYPAPGPARGEALKWLVWCNVHLAEATSRWQRNTRAQIPVEERSAAAAAVARKDIDKRLAIFDGALADRPYVLGSKPSIVDFHLGAAIGWMAFAGVAMEPFPHVRAWLERLQSRPAFAKLRSA